MRCATPSPAQNSPEQRRDLLFRGWPTDDRSHRCERAALHLLDTAGLLEHPAVREHTDIDFLSTGGWPWWYAKVNWTALRSEPTVADPDGATGRLLRLAVSLATDNLIDPHDVLVNLGPEHAQIVATALARATGVGADLAIAASPSRCDHRFTYRFTSTSPGELTS
ncbi:hypothetical protein ACFWPX_13530 [Nocardia sp. NPDC058518]|uniref:hypothetical protein n=1 Tax=Nocardia sp. NPDC058518 TaxID=3346534 RepID=UPI00365ECC6E